MNFKVLIGLIILILVLILGYEKMKNNDDLILEQTAPLSESFASDLAFLKKHTNAIVLTNKNAAVVVAPAYQGRVMTSTYDQKAGPSFGWINRPVIEKGFLSEKEKEGTLEEQLEPIVLRMLGVSIKTIKNGI